MFYHNIAPVTGVRRLLPGVFGRSSGGSRASRPDRGDGTLLSRFPILNLIKMSHPPFSIPLFGACL